MKEQDKTRQSIVTSQGSYHPVGDDPALCKIGSEVIRLYRIN
jgi:hypothetical protein